MYQLCKMILQKLNGECTKKKKKRKNSNNRIHSKTSDIFLIFLISKAKIANSESN